MVRNKHYKAFLFFFLILTGSCSSSNRNQESVDSQKSDSILNAQVKAMIDSTLSPYIRLQWESFNIISSYSNNDTIKNIKGTICSDQYFNKTFDVVGSYKIHQNSPYCKFLSVNHEKVGNIFEMKEMYDSIFTFYTDSTTFLKKLYQYWEHPDKEDQIVLDRFNLVPRAYTNETKVHFGISEDEYNRLGEEFQRNFYEGLIGDGAYELAEPIFRTGKFVGFEIKEIHDKTFNYYNVQNNAELVRKRQHGFGANETFWWVYACELYNMEIMSRYDKFDRRTKNSLKCYWNEYTGNVRGLH